MRRASLVLWLSAENVKRFAREAPDLWAWRSAVLDFNLRVTQQQEVHGKAVVWGSADLEQRQARLIEIRKYLAKGERRHPDIRLLLETAELEEGLGNPGQAYIDAEQAMALTHRFDDARTFAKAKGRIGDILQALGELDEALRFRRAWG